MDSETLNKLISKYLDGTASREETEQLNAWYGSLDDLHDVYPPDLRELSELARRSFEELKRKLGLK